MKPITAPLKLGQIGPDVANLQEILMAAIGTGGIDIPGKEDLIDRLAEEREKQLFGSATYELINIFKTAHGTSDSNDPDAVNPATATALNALNPPIFSISGHVMHRSGKQLEGTYELTISLLGYTATSVIASAVPITPNGAYSYSNTLSALSASSITIDPALKNGIRVALKNAAFPDIDIAVQDTYSYGTEFNVSFTLDGADIAVVPEYEAVRSALQAAIGDVAISAVIINSEDAEDTLTLLANKTGESRQCIRQMVQAHQMHEIVPAITAEAAYGLFRQGLPNTIQALVTQPADVLYNALKMSVATDIIATDTDTVLHTRAAAIRNAVVGYLLANTGMQAPEEGGLYKVALNIAGDGGYEIAIKILNAYSAHLLSAELSLEDAFADPDISGEYDRFKNALQLLLLTGNNAVLVMRLLSIMAGTQEEGDPALPGADANGVPSILGWITPEQWGALIEQLKNDASFFPAFISGSTADQKKAAYTQFLDQQFNLAFPTHAAVKAISADTNSPFTKLKAHLEDFMIANPGFDLHNVPVNILATSNAFDFSAITDAYEEEGEGETKAKAKATFIEEAGILQRLMNVTQNQQLVSAMAADGLHSSMQISRQAPAAFVDAYQDVAGSRALAQDIYDAATYRTSFTYSTLLDIADQANSQMAYALTRNNADNALADWRTLFGSIDGCNCSQCQSVYSPAAYLTDLLQFLKNNLPQAYELLMERRPDIKDIDLVCKNINTPVPHIDIINELLEDLVSAVAYSHLDPTSYINDSYQLYARQTVADAVTQRALPEYVNTFPNTGMKLRTWTGSSYQDAFVKNPYDKLKDAVYPSALPYNFYKRQIDTHLGIIGIKGYELQQSYSDKDRIEAWDGMELCMAYLGLSDKQLDTITVEQSNPYAYYGLQVNVVFNPLGEDLYYIQDPSARGALYPVGEPFQTIGSPIGQTGLRSNWLDHLAFRVDVFLQQAQLTYAELRTVLDCYCINPRNSITGRKMAIELTNATTQGDVCDLSRYKITGLDMPVAKRLYRFVRLKKALGWSYYDLDQALISLSGIEPLNAITQAGSILIDTATVKQLVQIDRLSKMLGLPVSTVLLLWKDIDDVFVYSDYEHGETVLGKSIYKQMFRNASAGNINEANYPFTVNSIGIDLATLNTTRKEEFHNYLSGTWGISASDLGILIQNLFPTGVIPAGSFGSFNLYGISQLYREVLLIKALNISVTEWIQYRSWIALNSNFNTASTILSTTYERTASPFTSPYDTLRFISFVNAGKEAGVSIAETGYLLLDAFQEPVKELGQNQLFAKSLTELRTELQKKTAPDYIAKNDVDGNALRGIAQLIVDDATADYLIKVIQNDPAISTDSISDRSSFLQAGPLAFSTAQAQDLTDYTTDPEDRRQQTYAILKPVIENAIRRPFIINFLSKEFKTDENIIKALAERCVKVATQGATPLSAMTVFLNNDFISSPSVIERTESTSALIPQFTVYVRLQKAAWLIQKFRLDLQDVLDLWSDQCVLAGVFSLSDLPVAVATGTSLVPDAAVTAKVPYYQWLGFLRWMEVITFLGKNKNLLYGAIREIPQPVPATTLAVRKEHTLKGIAKAFYMPVDDLTALLGAVISTLTNGALNVAFSADVSVPNEYNKAALYLRIMDCLEMQHLLPSPMSALVKVAGAVAAPNDQQAANEIIQVAKAQYDEAQWLEVVRPVNDLLRTERRDAMVGYLLHNRPYKYINSWYTSNDIFETLMVDVDMMSCMSTTRVLLAVNTIQLWVDRILLGLEKYVAYDVNSNPVLEPLVLQAPQARQWNMWRKLYRVWEANRKIFLYPENWIEPELRDDKSPFFKELEKFLKQNELTGENVEEAYRTYLERLEEVAHLEVIGICREVDVAGRIIVHAFGRTASNPHIYFYRKRIDTEWTAWEKMDVQIDGDHFVPVVWRGRLRFYWLTFTKEQQYNHIQDSQNRNLDSLEANVRWKIDMVFTEYKNNKWTPKQIGKQTLYSPYMNEQDPKDENDVFVYGRPILQGPVPTYINRKWYLSGSMEKQKREISFYSSISTDGNLQFHVYGKIEYINQIDMFDIFFDYRFNLPPYNYYLPDPLSLHKNFDFVMNSMKSEEFYSYKQRVNFGLFTHKYDGIVSSDFTSIEQNIYTDEVIQQNHLYSKDLENHLYKNAYSKFLYSKTGLYNTGSTSAYYHFPDANSAQPNGIKLLNRAPDVYLQGSYKHHGKYLVFPLQKPEGYQEGSIINIPAFFYTDYNNNFFVEKVHVDRFMISSDPNCSPENYPILYERVNTSSFLYRFRYLLKYHFQEFSHGQVEHFREQLYKNGLDEFLKRDFITGLADSVAFAATYDPTSSVLKGTNGKMYPNNKVDFSLEGSYALYNWELFYHIPMLIANKLTQDQKFDEARKWYHYVFNPTVGDNNVINGNATVEKFWNFPVFYDNATSIPTPLDLMRSSSLATAVARWAADPFKPHLVARTRVSAYMKNTVMKYLDNLVGWADMLFRTDTRENINEATLLYVLAAQLLGRKPGQMAATAIPVVQTYISLVYATMATGGLNAFSNGVVKAENVLMVSTGATSASVLQQLGVLPVTPDSMFYFCIPPNDKLAGYWDTLADRLFKIRNCRNIDGIERELALFDPPIDPALLVKAAAAGLSLSEALADINAPLPVYRFNVMAQKATELTQEVKGLGSQMLAALEKKDAEHLSLLRSSQELTMLSMVTEVKEQQVADSVAQINGLQQQKKMTTQKRDYYKRLVDTGLNAHEQLQLDKMQDNIPLSIAQGSAQTLAGILSIIPNFKIGPPTTVGATFGGANLGSIASAAANALGTVANVNSIIGQMAGTKGSYARRKEEWGQQLKTAELELKQLDYQILGAQIRQAVGEMELRNHKVQMTNAQQMDEAMHNKYTNEELYEWMVSEISATYFQAYKLAMDVAKRAERCYRHELGIESSDFIQPTYWDSLKKGLLAGEQLMFDLKRMEVSFLEKNKRSLELTKHISLAQLSPDKLMDLKTKQKCTIDLPEWLFDLDYPGQHLRRIKSVSVSIPCVAGPYTTVSCKLSLVSSKYRNKATVSAQTAAAYTHPSNYKQLYGSIQSIATSSAQNDSGMFEFSFRDERYLPFEGAGAISTWKIALPAAYAQFDYDSISDVILHVNYTALDEGGLVPAAKAYVEGVFSSTGAGFLRGFSLKEEFSNEWHAYGNRFTAEKKALSIKLSPQHFPFFMREQHITVKGLTAVIRPKKPLDGTYKLTASYILAGAVTNVALTLDHETPVSLHIDGNAKILKLVMTKTATAGPDVLENMADLLDDVYLVAHSECVPHSSNPNNFPLSNDVDWEENDPPKSANMLGWWCSNKGVTHQGSAVTGWADQSTYHRDVAPLDTAYKPAYENGAIKNTSSQVMLKLSNYLNIGKVYTLSFVVEQGIVNRVLMGSKAIYSSGTSYGLYFGAGSTLNHAPLPSFFTVIGPTALPTSGYHSYRIERNNQDISIYCDGILVGIQNINTNDDFIIDNLYGDSAMNSFIGNIKDIIIYNKLLSTQEKAQLANYLDVTYGL